MAEGFRHPVCVNRDLMNVTRTQYSLQHQVQLILVERPQAVRDDIEMTSLDQIENIVNGAQILAVIAKELQTREDEREA